MNADRALQALAEVRMGFLLLTRIPVGNLRGTVPTMGASAWCWPLAGLAVGGIAALVWCAGNWAGLPPLPAAGLALLAMALLTGAMHEDGLADLADGFWGGKDKARRLEIMRDSRLGSYGALAIGFSLLLRGGVLAGLSPCGGALALVALATASRAAMPLALRVMPPARADGLGHVAGDVTGSSVIAALTLGACGLLLAGPTAALAAAVTMALAGLALGMLALRKIGGQTGDVLGALQQVMEMAGWLALSVVLSPT